jgi:hypothetical protein
MIMPIIAMIMGFYFGYRIGKDKELPKVEIKTPIEIIEEYKEKQQEKQDKEELEQYLANLDNFPNNQIRFKE